jgi:bacillithiol system protein YtxJ
MGIFNSFFGNKEGARKESYINWVPLTSLEQLAIIKEESKEETIFIFKHSTRCGISSMLIKGFENLFDESMKNIKVYYLDLLNYRDVSDEVGYLFQVMHQSPQLLVIRNEAAVFNASHYDITTTNIQQYL